VLAQRRYRDSRTSLIPKITSRGLDAWSGRRRNEISGLLDLSRHRVAREPPGGGPGYASGPLTITTTTSKYPPPSNVGTNKGNAAPVCMTILVEADAIRHLPYLARSIRFSHLGQVQRFGYC
jgi:hypothetical protein